MKLGGGVYLEDYDNGELKKRIKWRRDKLHVTCARCFLKASQSLFGSLMWMLLCRCACFFFGVNQQLTHTHNITQQDLEEWNNLHVLHDAKCAASPPLLS